MEFEDAKNRLEEIRANLTVEKDGWRTLLETVLEKAETGKEGMEATLNEQKENAVRAQVAIGRLDHLRTVATNADTVNSQIVEPIQAWLSQFNEQVQNLQGSLGKLLPAFAMPTEEIADAANELQEQLETKTRALAEAVGERLIEARVQIEANLTESVTLVESAVEDLFEGVDESIREALESLGEFWEEARDSIVVAKDAVLTTGDAAEEILKTAARDAIDKVAGNLTSLSESIDDLLATLQETMTTLERTLELVGEATDGTAVGMSGASSSLDVVRQIMSSVS